MEEIFTLKDLLPCLLTAISVDFLEGNLPVALRWLRVVPLDLLFPVGVLVFLDFPWEGRGMIRSESLEESESICIGSRLSLLAEVCVLSQSEFIKVGVSWASGSSSSFVGGDSGDVSAKLGGEKAN